ncbi:conserved Plasmodium protein, unknown function [Plasmodium gaboni]|uniref:F-box domain-containing protein n=1 Tax=Plasmodium gaboni TaxID=647221 RepID=A0ABY1UKB5_9APIC|nr:conserved Plasmodium protein, unknown function [Plasmodium gaboni]
MKVNKKHHLDNECIFNNCTPLSTPRSISYIMNSNECYDYKINKIEYISSLKRYPKEYNIFKNSDIICHILSFLTFTDRWKYKLLNKSFYQAFHTKYAWISVDFRFLNVDLYNFFKKYNKLFLNTFSLSMSITGDQSVEMIINFIFKHFNKLKDLRLYFRKKNTNFIYEGVHPIVSNLLNCKYLKNNNRQDMHKRKKKNSLSQKKETTTNNNNKNNNDNNNKNNNDNDNNNNIINCNEYCSEEDNLQTPNIFHDALIEGENNSNILRHTKKKKINKHIHTSTTKKEKNIEHAHNNYNSVLDNTNHYNDIHNNMWGDNINNNEESNTPTDSSTDKEYTPFSYEHIDCSFELNDLLLQNNYYQKYLEKKNKEKKKNEIIEKYLHIIQSKKIWSSKTLNISNNFECLERLIIDVELKGEELLCFVGKFNNLKDIIISKLVYSNKLNRSQSIIIFTSFIEKMKQNNIRLIQLGLYFRNEQKPIDYLNNEKFRKILNERKEYVYDINKEEGDELIYILQKNHLNSLYCLWSNDLFISFEMYEQIKKFNNLKIWILPGWRALSLAKQ